MTYTNSEFKEYMETLGLDETELACVLNLKMNTIKEWFNKDSIVDLDINMVFLQMDALLKYKKIMDLKNDQIKPGCLTPLFKTERFSFRSSYNDLDDITLNKIREINDDLSWLIKNYKSLTLFNKKFFRQWIKRLKKHFVSAQ